MASPISIRCILGSNEVQLYAFDILAMGGDDLRSLPLYLRKANLEQLYSGRPVRWTSKPSRGPTD
jgi:ATP-dependent DNA ligase